MKPSIRPLVRRGLGLAAPLALALACSGTETDNPVTSAPPAEAPESPIQFEGQPEPPGCVPDDRDGPPRLAQWAEGAGLLVGWDEGLVVIDTSDPSAPRQLARVAIEGYARQVLLEPNTVTIAVDQWPSIADVPPGRLQTVTRLLRYDITQPDAPVRVAELTLDGEFWQLVPQPGGYWLMSARLEQSEPQCELVPTGCYIDREALSIDRITFSDGALARGERLELPYVSEVFSGAGGFATLAGTDGAAVLHAALFDGSGGVQVLDPFPVEHALYGDPSPIVLQSDRVVVLGPTVHVYDTAGQRLGGVDVRVPVGAESHVIGSGAFVASFDPREAGAHVDLTDPAEPRVTPLVDVSEVLPIEEPGGAAPRRALGWFQDDTGLELSLLSLETSPPSVIDRLATEYDLLDSAADFWVDGVRGFFVAHAAGGGRVFGAIDWAGDNLSLQAPIGEGYSDTAFEIGGYSYVLDGNHVLVSAFGGRPAEAIELGRETVFDATSSAAGQARLVTELDGDRRLDVERAGVTESLPVSRAAERVLAAGERWLVLETNGASGCQAASAGCPQPFVTVVGDTPLRALARVDLPLLNVPLGPGSSVTQRWPASDEYGTAPVALSGGRWVLVRELELGCRGQADCDALGLQVMTPEEAAAQGINVGASVVDCPPQEPGTPAPCPEQPELPEEFGMGARREFFVIDPSTASLGASASVDAPGASYFAPDVRLASAPEETLLSLRIEPGRFLPGQPRRGRFVLDRIRIDAAGPVNAGSNVVPGYPLGLLDADTLVSAQPTAEYQGAARLVRSDFTTLGVAIDAERGVEARYRDAVLVSGHAIVVRWPSDACLASTVIESWALDADLAPVQRVELPGSAELVGVYGSEVIFSDRGQRFTRVYVAPGGNLTVAGEANAHEPLYDVEWFDGTLYGLSRGQVERLPL